MLNATSPLAPNNPSDSIKNISWDDATWIMTSSFIIFTMQSVDVNTQGLLDFRIHESWIHVKLEAMLSAPCLCSIVVPFDRVMRIPVG
ncbi:hypothetical protein TNCT_477571 [Trichonephila clavata]|uniref:Uncharacterized protein n=1 Tax=Trichonephila clavata TaxID=2740835 RepID=A0A8X6K2K6_TRICU|nr:hypothetical protein TNCT_477571 [Trichonephila clavata]